MSESQQPVPLIDSRTLRERVRNGEKVVIVDV